MTQKGEKVKGERTIHTVRGVGHVRCDPETYRDLVVDLGPQRKRWDHVFKQEAGGAARQVHFGGMAGAPDGRNA